MRIEITRSGGIGGLTRRWSVDVSTTEAEQRWLPLAEAEAAAPDAPDDQRDRFTYVITIGYTEVSVPESRLEEPWRELIDRARADTTAPDPHPSDNARSIAQEEPGRPTPPS